LNELPGIGHNLPPLGEQLVLETIALETRIAERVASAQERAVVATEDDAEKATLLLAMMRELYGEIDAARIERKAPYLEAGRGIDAHFTELQLPLVGPSPKQKLTGAYGELHARLDAFRRRQEAEATAERRRLEEEARRQREAAEAAERARLQAEQAQRDAATQVEREKARRQKAEAELAQRKAQDAAAQFDARAAAAEAPQTIHSGYGPRASRRTVYRVEIVDLSLALRHCLKVDQHKIRDAVQAVYDRQLRAGVRELPGAKIIEDSITQVRK
jgi:type IV secretory pathway VirB10-like protein